MGAIKEVGSNIRSKDECGILSQGKKFVWGRLPYHYVLATRFWLAWTITTQRKGGKVTLLYQRNKLVHFLLTVRDKYDSREKYVVYTLRIVVESLSHPCLISI